MAEATGICGAALGASRTMKVLGRGGGERVGAGPSADRVSHLGHDRALTAIAAIAHPWWRRRLRAAMTAVAAFLVATASQPLAGSSPGVSAALTGAPDGTAVLLDITEGGSWSWFQGERVIIDEAGERLYASLKTSVEEPGTTRVVEAGLADGRRRIVDLGRAAHDEHDSGAIWEAPDGSVLTSWSRHNKEPRLYMHRRSPDGRWAEQGPLDMAEGGNESLGDQSVGAARNNNTSYTNLYAVDDPAGEGGKRLYNFSRQLGWDPTVATSLDGGRSWVQLGRLLSDPGDDPRTRPYAQYTAGGDRVDFVVTDGHPDSVGSSAYHGYLRGGQVHDSYGRVLGALGDAVDIRRLTPVLRSGAAGGPGGPDDDVWLADLAIDPVTEGPVAVLTRRIGEESGTARNDFYYARWGADGWDVRRVADAGTPLFVRPTHYTGLAALNPADPGQVVIATNADPVSGAPLRSAADGERHYELYRGQRDDDGGFGWVSVTADSDAENMRPVWASSPSGADALVWLRGHYRSYSRYRFAVVGLLHRSDGSTVEVSRAPAHRADVAARTGNGVPSAAGRSTIAGAVRRRTGRPGQRRGTPSSSCGSSALRPRCVGRRRPRTARRAARPDPRAASLQGSSSTASPSLLQSVRPEHSDPSNKR